MNNKILDGKALAAQIRQEIHDRIQHLQAQVGRSPGLAVVMVGDDPASTVYVRNKERACEKVGIVSFGRQFSAQTGEAELGQVIQELNQDDRIDGILIQLPLPAALNASALLHQIDPNKDVDGLHPVNLGRLLRGELGLRSCTPAGVMRLLQTYQVDLAGKRAIVVGRSILVGKPLALMLLEANATVTIAHSQTTDLARQCREADLLVAAVGRPHLIRGDMVKPGAVVVDVGINRMEDDQGRSRLVGDVDFETVQAQASLITPVPGGVGPMTVALLLQNTLWSYCQRYGLPTLTETDSRES